MWGRVAMFVALTGAATSTFAVDRPIGAAKLIVRRAAPGEKLLFVSKDPAFAFPGIDSLDDPSTGFPGGAIIDVFSAVEAPVSFVAAAGTGDPGWTVKERRASRHVFRNPDAPGGLGPVKRIVLDEGHVLRIFAKEAGLTLAAPTTRIAVRVTTGSLRNCAVFAGDEIRRNVPGSLVARKAPSPAIPDCSDASLLGLPTTTTTTLPPCGESAPTCGGTCPSGEACASYGLTPPFNTCGCLPYGSTPCGSPGYPVCGGACPSGLACAGIFGPPAIGGIACDCLAPGATCSNGFAFGGFPLEGIPFACYPIPCSCGAACGDGGVCSPFTLVGTGFSSCLCAVPAPCTTGTDGYVCPEGEVCSAGPALLDRVCEAP